MADISGIRAGDIVGPYRLAQRIGQGGTGVVYLAHDTEHDRDVALKILLPEIVSDETTRARFAREARAAAGLQHRNIVSVLDFSEEGEWPYIAMEFLRGGSLATKLASDSRLTAEAMLDIVIQLCEGLQYAHDRGLVHRDVKPANVWLLPDGGVKLLDFGIAKIPGTTFTRSGVLVGTAGYMAPEQLSGMPLDRRVDIFSAGVILYELVAGRRPFEADTIASVVRQVLQEEPPSLSTVAPETPAEVIAAAETALKKNRDERYAEASELGADLRLARYAVQAPRPSAPTPSRIPAPPSAVPNPTTTPNPFDESLTTRIDVMRSGHMTLPVPAPAPRPPQASPRRRSIGPWIAVSLSLVAVVGAVAYRMRTPSTPATVESHPPPAVTAPPAEKPSPSPPPLLVQSTPSGAHILVDGRDSGLVTPADLRVPETGTATIRLRLDGFDEAEQQLTPSMLAGGMLAVTLNAVAQPRPEGGVIVHIAGTYPFLVAGCGRQSHEAADHVLHVNPPCGLALTSRQYFLNETIQISADRPRLELQAPPLVTVRFSTTRHDSCRVQIDNRGVGNARSLDLQQIAVGEHEVVLYACSDGRPYSGHIRIEPGQPTVNLDDIVR
jgi:serine/threonine-protein kinase